MKKLINQIIGAALLSCAVTVGSTGAHAQTVVTGTVTNRTAPIYTFFSFSGGAIEINTIGSSFYDPSIYLFADNGSALGNLTGAILGYNDDFYGLQSRLSFNNLSSGNYVLAFGRYSFSEVEARTNVDDSIYAEVGSTYKVNFSQTVGVHGAVATPGPVAGAGIPAILGIAGAWFVSRRKRKLAT